YGMIEGAAGKRVFPRLAPAAAGAFRFSGASGVAVRPVCPGGLPVLPGVL
ncbi:unnamed protein product, partial [marine sediment metagenome]